MIEDSLTKLKLYIEKSEYKGFDPYDALKSPLFRLPILNNNKFFRFGTQQLVKRLPFSIRSVLFIPKGYNPVTLGLAIQAYAYLFVVEPENQDEYLNRIDSLVKELKTLIPKEYSGACWGYDFDWEARHANIPAYQPTVVATGIITNALYIAYDLVGHRESLNLVLSASNFILNDLHRTYSGENFCFSYSPFDNQQVFNASMKGVRLLAQTYSITKENKLKNLAKKAINFVVNQQREDGSWGYSLAKKGGWIDNYHTGYILDCLYEYQFLTGDNDYSSKLKNGYIFYKSNFISKDGVPKFYNNNIYPIDCTSAAQTILTTLKFGDKRLSRKVSNWMVDNMQKDNGSFKFRKFKNYTITTSFMRWSDAWMFVALSYNEYIRKL